MLIAQSVQGLKIEPAVNNVLTLEVEKSDFMAEWNGFDALRDLVIETKLRETQ